TGEQRPGVVAAEQRGSEVDDVLVDETGPVEVAGHRCTALHQQLDDPTFAELVEQVGQVALELDRRLHARLGRGGPQHHPERISALDVADGQLRIVGADGASTHDDGVALGPEAVHVCSGRSPGD